MSNLQIIGDKVRMVDTSTPILKFSIVATHTGWALDYKKVFFGWKNTGETTRHPMSWGSACGYDAMLRDAEKVLLTIARQLLGS